MEALFTILVVAMAIVVMVGMMYMVMREKIDHEAHTRYVRSPWTDEAIETQNAVDAHLQQGDEDVADTVPVTEEEAGEKPNA